MPKTWRKYFLKKKLKNPYHCALDTCFFFFLIYYELQLLHFFLQPGWRILAGVQKQFHSGHENSAEWIKWNIVVCAQIKQIVYSNIIRPNSTLNCHSINVTKTLLSLDSSMLSVLDMAETPNRSQSKVDRNKIQTNLRWIERKFVDCAPKIARTTN